MTFGPRSERIYTVRLPKKMRVKALYTLLSQKHRDGEVLFVDSLSFDNAKTKDAWSALTALGKASGAEKITARRKNRAFIALSEGNTQGARALRNIPGIHTDELRNLNPVDVLSAPYLIIEMPEVALKALESKLARA